MLCLHSNFAEKASRLQAKIGFVGCYSGSPHLEYFGPHFMYYEYYLDETGYNRNCPTWAGVLSGPAIESGADGETTALEACCGCVEAAPMLSMMLPMIIAGYRRTLVLDNRTAYHGYFEFLRLETGFVLSCSWSNDSCYGVNRNRSGLIFMKISKLASGHRISTAFNGQNYFFKIVGSKVLDEYYNSYLRK
jgi:hypothetical protein